MAHNVYPLLF